jgi:hypothetical protein
VVNSSALLWLTPDIKLGFEPTCIVPALQIVNHKPSFDGLHALRNALRAVLAEYSHPLSGLSVSGPSPEGVANSEWLIVD